jgi:putative phosphoribosyl transferase
MRRTRWSRWSEPPNGKQGELPEPCPLGGVKEKNMPVEEQAVQIPVGRFTLEGDLTLPDPARGVALFAHGSGSSRHSPRNRYVARVLQHSGLATLLMDLLTEEEEVIDARTAALRFDIGFLAKRLAAATRWLRDQPQTSELPLGYFGASTGAAAALVAAAELPELVAAVVSRGGRPDLAGDSLRYVKTPTLLIVGSRDYTVLKLNRQALTLLDSEKGLKIISGATHLFAETGALEQVAELARDWFVSHLRAKKEDKEVAA